MKNIIVFIILIFSLNAIYSQDTNFNFSAELRPRVLINNGYKNPISINDNSNAYISQRTRINIEFNKPILKTYISIQDVRIWGDDNNYKTNGLFGNTESISLHQAWFILNTTKYLSFKIGRQLFKYDDQRILSSRNWNDYQVSYDAFLMQLDNEKNRLDLGLSWNSETPSCSLYPKEKFKLFNFIRYERNISNFTFSCIGFITGNTINDTIANIYFRGTYGVNLNFMKNNFKIRSSFYYQNNINNYDEKISAYCFSIFAKQNMLHEKLFIGLGLDYLSGNNQTNTSNNYINTNHNFNILYGKRHGYYGYLDYFSTTPDQGLQDYMIKTEYNFSNKFTLNIDYHYFLLAENINEITNKNLGQELDFTLKWKLLNNVSLQTAYSFYLITETLKQLKDINNKTLRFPHFSYIMIIVKPVLFEK